MPNTTSMPLCPAPRFHVEGRPGVDRFPGSDLRAKEFCFRCRRPSGRRAEAIPPELLGFPVLTRCQPAAMPWADPIGCSRRGGGNLDGKTITYEGPLSSAIVPVRDAVLTHPGQPLRVAGRCPAASSSGLGRRGPPPGIFAEHGRFGPTDTGGFRFSRSARPSFFIFLWTLRQPGRRPWPNSRRVMLAAGPPSSDTAGWFFALDPPPPASPPVTLRRQGGELSWLRRADPPSAAAGPPFDCRHRRFSPAFADPESPAPRCKPMVPSDYLTR